MKNIEKSIKMLLDSNAFYAHFFLNSKISYNHYGVKTAGACVTQSGTQLIFNTEFVESLTTEELCGVVEHEVLHILFDHVHAMKYDKYLDKHIANIAMDLSINQYIKNLPKDCVSLSSIKKITGLDLEPLQNWEYYYQKLMDKKEELEKTYPIDDHDLQVSDQCKEGEGREVLRDAIDKAIKASRGNVPSHILKVFDTLSSESKVPWKQVLANFIARATASTSKNTRKKTNRRFGIDQPGKIKQRELTLGVCTDSSGSVSDESYQQFMAEIIRISKICGTTFIIDADCTVQNVEKIKKNKPVKTERHGSGGTAYQPAIDECKKLKCDAIVYFGDFDCADKPENPGLPFLWVGVGDQPPPASFGSVIRI